jgi:general secretion pathway protein H
MQIWTTGSNALLPSRLVWSAVRRPRGFTLIELLVVLAIVGTVVAGITWVLPENGQTRLEVQTQRLAAMLEGARAQSRTLGVPVRWRATADGFAWEGLPAQALPTTWGEPGIKASSAQPLLLGPEPIIAAQSVRVWLTEQPDKTLTLSTDGVRPFAVQTDVP